MQLQEALKSIMEGKAILFAGSGFSYGATNISGEGMKTGTELRDFLGEKAGLNEDDYKKYELDQISDYFIAKKESNVRLLISFLKDMFTVKEVSSNHKQILAVPWKRIYTTNYDDVIEIAGRENGKSITPITFSNPLSNQKKDICVHLNGFISRLNESTLNNEFKLTRRSYNADSLNGNPWFEFMIEDFKSAKAIVILGFSMSSDLDITRIFALPQISKKIIFIDKEIADPIAKQKFMQYADLEEIGMDGFADALRECPEIYPSLLTSKTDFICFNYEHMTPLSPCDITYDAYVDFYILGKYEPFFFRKDPTGEYKTVTNRKAITIFLQNWTTQKYFLVTASLGNGKTVFCDLLKNELKEIDCHVFTFCHYSEDDLSLEIEEICQSKERTVVFIDDCYKHLEVIRRFQLYGSRNIVFVLTSRLGIASIVHKKIAESFKVKEHEIFRLNLQTLSMAECNGLAYILNNEKLILSDFPYKNIEDMGEYFFRECNASLANILLKLLQSSNIKKKLDCVFSDVMESEKNELRKLIIVGFANSVWSLGLSVDDIFDLLKINPYSYQNDGIFLEFFNIEKGEFRINSSVFAETMIQNIVPPDCLREVLVGLVLSMSDKYRSVPRYEESMKAVMSHANFNNIIQKQHGANEIKKFYDSLRNEPFFKENPFYWEEFAATCIDTSSFPTAKICIKNAYRCGENIQGFIPFQIATVEADYYLELCLHENMGLDDVMSNVQTAKDLLVKYYHHPQNNHAYVFSVSRKFIRIFDIYRKDFETREFSIFSQVIQEIHSKLLNYMNEPIGKYDNRVKDFMEDIDRIINELKASSFDRIKERRTRGKNH